MFRGLFMAVILILSTMNSGAFVEEVPVVGQLLLASSPTK
jgi:hypothetical protein